MRKGLNVTERHVIPERISTKTHSKRSTDMSKDLFNLDGDVAVVTGAGRGIG